MSGLREQIANDLARGDMSSSDTEETALDRIGALARVDPLGASLWRVMSVMDVGSFLDARRHLVDRLTTDIPLTDNEKTAVAQLAIQEWLACQCVTCGGRKFLPPPEGSKTRRICPTCIGSGRGVYTPEQRMAALKVGPAQYARISHLFDEAHTILTAADARVERQLSYQLAHKPLKRKA